MEGERAACLHIHRPEAAVAQQRRALWQVDHLRRAGESCAHARTLCSGSSRSTQPRLQLNPNP